MGLAGQAIDRAVPESQNALYYIVTFCQVGNKWFGFRDLGRKKFSLGSPFCRNL